MTDKEKAKAYDRALEIAKAWCKLDNNDLSNDDLKTLFPELRESEDEKVRKEIISALKNANYKGVYDKHLAWLEKQGTSYTKRDVDDAYLKGVRDTKNEIEKQYEANYQTRKDIATFIFNYRGDIKDRAKWMDYLGIKVSFVEKQGEQKVPVNDFKAKDWYVSKIDGKIHNIYHSVDKVEPKFHEGDWAVSNLDGKARQVSEVHFDEYNSYYVVDGKSVNLEEYDRLHYLWTIADAKDGDVLAFDNDTIVIFKNLYNSTTFHSYCHIEDGVFDVSKDVLPDWWEGKDFYPATKEQRDFLFAKMKEYGYEWDSEKKELIKIKNYDDKLREAICE